MQFLPDLQSPCHHCTVLATNARPLSDLVVRGIPYLGTMTFRSALFLDTWYPASIKKERRDFVPSRHRACVVLASRSSLMYYNRTQSNSCPGNLAKLVANAPLKRVEEFLNPWGSLVQVSCSLFPMCGFSHSKANSGWLTGATKSQKKTSFKSKQVNHLAVEGISPSKLYGLGTARCRVIVASFTAPKSWTGRQSCVPGFFTGSDEVFQGDWHFLRGSFWSSLSKWALIPIWASRGIRYCRNFTSWAPRSIRMGAWCFARPRGFPLAQTSGFSVSNLGGMVSYPGGEEYRHYSSSLLTMRVIIKENGSPASFSWSISRKEICVPILASRSLPIKGTGQLGR